MAETFAGRDGWDALSSRMSSPAPAPEVELSEWPTVTYGPELVLDVAAEGSRGRLRERVPDPAGSAWETAIGLLTDSHVGMARGHVVTEAWIDDLGKWVILDGQNGAWWGSATEPLGWSDLMAVRAAGRTRPDMVTTTGQMTPDDMDAWWTYVDTAISSGLAWSRPFAPYFQQEPVTVRLLAAPSTVTHPDLSELETGLVDLGEGPGVAFRPAHPYATGVRVGDTVVEPDAPVAVTGALAGRCRIPVAAVTRYGDLPSHTLAQTGRT